MGGRILQASFPEGRLLSTLCLASLLWQQPFPDSIQLSRQVCSLFYLHAERYKLEAFPVSVSGSRSHTLSREMPLCIGLCHFLQHCCFWTNERPTFCFYLTNWELSDSAWSLLIYLFHSCKSLHIIYSNNTVTQGKVVESAPRSVPLLWSFSHGRLMLSRSYLLSPALPVFGIEPRVLHALSTHFATKPHS